MEYREKDQTILRISKAREDKEEQIIRINFWIKTKFKKIFLTIHGNTLKIHGAPN